MNDATKTAGEVTNLAVLTRTVEDLAARSIQFGDEEDDLGHAKVARLTHDGITYAIEHIEGSPNSGVSVILLDRTSDPVGALWGLLSHLDIPGRAVCWHWDGSEWVEGAPHPSQARSA